MKQANDDLKVIVKEKELVIHTIKITSNCEGIIKNLDKQINEILNIQ